MCLFGDSWTDTEPDLNMLRPCNKHMGIFCNSTASWNWNILKNRQTFKKETGLLGERTYSDDMPHWKATDPRIKPVTFLLQGDSADHSVAPPLSRWSKTTALLFTNKRAENKWEGKTASGNERVRCSLPIHALSSIEKGVIVFWILHLCATTMTNDKML